MSPEYALYLQLLLMAGVTEPFEQWFNAALEQDTYDDPLLDIMLRPSDPEWVMGVLGEYMGRFPKPDGQVACDWIRKTLWDMRSQGTPPDRLCEIMYIVSRQLELYFSSEQLDSMDALGLLYAEAEEGLIDRDAVLRVLDDFLQNGTSISDLSLYQLYRPAPPARMQQLCAVLRRWFSGR